MEINFNYLLLVVIFLSSSKCLAEEAVIQLQLRRPVNFISDKFISFSVDPSDLLDILNNTGDVFSRRNTELGPSYLKVTGPSVNQLRLVDKRSESSTSFELTNEEWKGMYDSVSSIGLKPVIALPYDPKNWDTREIIRILGKSSSLNMSDCFWQLGSDFKATDAINYIDDLSTLRTIVDALSTGRQNNWGILGSDLSVGSSEEEVRLYSELSKHMVEAISWTQPFEFTYSDERVDDVFSSMNIEPALRSMLNSKLPVWLSLSSLPKTSAKSSEPMCDTACVAKGLNWAQILGDAAKDGFNVVYQPIDKNEFLQPSLSYYISFLHKRIAGERVFNTKILNGDKLSSHFYSHCTKNMPGAFTVMGVNMGDRDLKTAAKVPINSGSEFMEYVLSVNKYTGKVQLNGEDIVEGSDLVPQMKLKRTNKPAFFSLPPHSVGFWVFSMAELKQCEIMDEAKREETPYQLNRKPKTSSELLIHQLIEEFLERDSKDLNKIERSENTMTKDLIKNNRSKRYVSNNIFKTNRKVNSDRTAQAKESTNSIHRRLKRFVMNSKRSRRANNLLDLLYNELDAFKRRSVLAPYRPALNSLLHTRSKRQITELSKLFGKFELKKPLFPIIKPPAPPLFGFGQPKPLVKSKPSNPIPPVATVHDIYSPSSSEKQIFKSIENPNLPNGDIHFKIGDEKSDDYVAVDDDDDRKMEKAANKLRTHERQPADDIRSQKMPNYYFDIVPEIERRDSYSQPGPMQGDNQEAVRPGELWEVDVARPAPIMDSSSNVRPPWQGSKDQAASQVSERNIDFVVKELEPTWQKNHENLAKARNTLQQFYLDKPSEISSILPNAGGLYQDSRDQAFFETRRRRRSVDLKMNDEIEQKLQKVTAQNLDNAGDFEDYVHLEDALDRATLLDRLIGLVQNIEKNQNIKSLRGFNKLNDNIRILEDIFSNGAEQRLQRLKSKSQSKLDDNEIKRKCRVMSLSMEQQCLRDETLQKRTLQKREAKVDREDKLKKKTLKPLKKPFVGVKEKLGKKSNRQKRSIPWNTQFYESDDKMSNMIPKEVIKDIDLAVKTVLDTDGIVRTVHKENNSVTNHIPRFMKVIADTVQSLMSTVTSKVSNWWQMMS